MNAKINEYRKILNRDFAFLTLAVFFVIIGTAVLSEMQVASAAARGKVEVILVAATIIILAAASLGGFRGLCFVSIITFQGAVYAFSLYGLELYLGFLLFFLGLALMCAGCILGMAHVVNRELQGGTIFVLSAGYFAVLFITAMYLMSTPNMQICWAMLFPIAVPIAAATASNLALTMHGRSISLRVLKAKPQTA